MERFWEEKEGSRSGSGGLTMERMGDRSTWEGRVAGTGGGRYLLLQEEHFPRHCVHILCSLDGQSRHWKFFASRPNIGRN